MIMLIDMIKLISG